MTLRVWVVDDHSIVRRGVRNILEDEVDIEVSGESSSGAEALSAIQEQSMDVLLLDVSLPDINGLEVLKQARQLKPKLRVLMLTMFPEEQYAVRALQEGAGGYLTKESAPEELVLAVRKIADGGHYISQTLAEKLATRITLGTEALTLEQLSSREFQVMQLLSAGSTLTEISEQLNLSVKTISTYRTRLLEKLGLKNNSELIRFAMQQGFI